MDKKPACPKNLKKRLAKETGNELEKMKWRMAKFQRKQLLLQSSKKIQKEIQFLF